MVQGHCDGVFRRVEETDEQVGSGSEGGKDDDKRARGDRLPGEAIEARCMYSVDIGPLATLGCTVLRNGRCRCLLCYFTGRRRRGRGGGRDLERVGMHRAAASTHEWGAAGGG